MWEAGRRTVCYDVSAGKTGDSFGNMKIQPTPSQRYDQSVAMWVQNAIPVRIKSSNRYDASLELLRRQQRGNNHSTTLLLREVDVVCQSRFSRASEQLQQVRALRLA